MNRSRILNRGLFALALLLLLPGLALAQNGNGNNNRQLNPLPVLIYTVSGGTLARETFETLIVYSNGTAMWSGSGTSDGVRTIQLSKKQVNELVRNLRQAGAFQGGPQGNRNTGGDDSLPLTTITAFFNPTGSGRSLAQTFSFFGSEGSRARVNNVIINFINNNFGGDT